MLRLAVSCFLYYSEARQISAAEQSAASPTRALFISRVSLKTSSTWVEAYTSAQLTELGYMIIERPKPKKGNRRAKKVQQTCTDLFITAHLNKKTAFVVKSIKYLHACAR